MLMRWVWTMLANRQLSAYAATHRADYGLLWWWVGQIDVDPRGSYQALRILNREPTERSS